MPDKGVTLPPEIFDTVAQSVRSLTDLIHQLNKRWWEDPCTGASIERNVGELLMLATSELAEALEGHRKGLKDSHLPKYDMLDVELADAVIRIFDMAGGLGVDLGGVLASKLQYNMTREDHTHAARLKVGGKKY